LHWLMFGEQSIAFDDRSEQMHSWIDR
jgi:hypothetical protein